MKPMRVSGTRKELLKISNVKEYLALRGRVARAQTPGAITNCFRNVHLLLSQDVAINAGWNLRIQQICCLPSPTFLEI